MNEQITQDGIALLTENGHEQGEYNPHNVRAWLIRDAQGPLGMVIGDCTQDALDNAADAGVLDRLSMEQEDYIEYSDNGWSDSFICLGNASEPFWSEYLHIEVAATTMEQS